MRTKEGPSPRRKSWLSTGQDVIQHRLEDGWGGSELLQFKLQYLEEWSRGEQGGKAPGGRGESVCRYEWFRMAEAQMGHRCFQKTTREKIHE